MAEFGQESDQTFKQEFDIWAQRPCAVIHRKMQIMVSHLPSLHKVSNEEFVFLTKDLLDRTVIVA